MNNKNREIPCILTFKRVFSEKTQKSYPAVMLELPDGTKITTFDKELINNLVSIMVDDIVGKEE